MLHSHHRAFSSLPIHFTLLHSLFKHFMTHLNTLVITFLTLCLQLCGLQGTVARASADSWFQSFMVLLTKENFPITVLCFLPHIFQSWSSLLRWHGPCNVSPIAVHGSSTVYEEGEYVRYLPVLRQGVPDWHIHTICKFSHFLLHPV